MKMRAVRLRVVNRTHVNDVADYLGQVCAQSSSRPYKVGRHSPQNIALLGLRHYNAAEGLKRFLEGHEASELFIPGP